MPLAASPDPFAASAPEIFNLSHGEQLLVWSWRKIASGRGRCPLIVKAFEGACGEDAPEVFAAFHGFLNALAFAGRRRFTVGHPGCFFLTPDERQAIALVAAAQEGEDALFEANLSWMARREHRRVMAMGARVLAAAFMAHDLRLPLPALPDAGSAAGRQIH